MIAWIVLVALLPLSGLPWSHALAGNCSPLLPACELMCCQDNSSDSHSGHAPGCPCDDNGPGCDCACCLHISSTIPPAAMSAPQIGPLNEQGIRSWSQRAPSRTERPPLPPPKPPHHFHHVGAPPASVQSNHSNLHIYENTVSDPRGHCRLHHPASLRVQHELLHPDGLLRVLLLLSHWQLL